MDKIEIKGYKSFKELKLDLLPINIPHQYTDRGQRVGKKQLLVFL